MSLFDSASLVVTPNGTKASKLYAIKPTDASGDLSVTRATTATRVNSSGLIESVATNVPRLDYTNSTCPSILVEPQRTNILTYSEGNLSTYDVSDNCTNAGVSINGFSNSIQVPSTGLTYFYKTATTILSQVYTLSCFIKMDDNSVPVLGANSSLGNLSFVAKGNIANDNLKVTLIGNNIYRISATTIGNGIPGFFGIVRYSTQTLKSFKISAIQLEAGSYATSYIPTEASSVTRNADLTNKTGISSLIGQTEGTLYGEFRLQTATGGSAYLGLTSGSFSNFILLGKEAPNKLVFGIRANGSNIIFNSSTALTSDYVKCAIAYKSGSWAAYLNGNLMFSGTNTFTFSAALNTLGFGSTGDFASLNDKMEIKSTALFKTRLTNEELASLTTI